MEIKDYRNKEIPLLLIGCTLLFLIISGEIEDTVGTTILSWIFSAVSGSVVSIFAFLGDAFISSKTKDFIVTLGKKISLPAQNVFERICKDGYDKRFKADRARTRYKTIYAEIENTNSKQEKRAVENDEWYRIYLTMRNEGSVAVAQRDYLLCRDAFFSLTGYLLFYILVCFVCAKTIFWSFIIILICLMAISYGGMWNRAYAFVDNVIAVDLGKNV